MNCFLKTATTITMWIMGIALVWFALSTPIFLGYNLIKDKPLNTVMAISIATVWFPLVLYMIIFNLKSWVYKKTFNDKVLSSWYIKYSTEKDSGEYYDDEDDESESWQTEEDADGRVSDEFLIDHFMKISYATSPDGVGWKDKNLFTIFCVPMNMRRAYKFGDMIVAEEFELPPFKRFKVVVTSSKDVIWNLASISED